MENSPFVELVRQNSIHVVEFADIPARAPKVSRLPSTPPDWAREQREDPVISRVLDYVTSGECPPLRTRQKETREVNLLLREWDRLVVKEGVLYRRRVDGEGENLK